MRGNQKLDLEEASFFLYPTVTSHPHTEWKTDTPWGTSINLKSLGFLIKFASFISERVRCKFTCLVRKDVFAPGVIHTRTKDGFKKQGNERSINRAAQHS